MFNDFLAIVFPECCLACDDSLERGERNICTHCRYHLPKTNSHLGESGELAQKFWGRVPIEHTLAYLKFTKGGNVQRLLHKLKYNGQQEMGEALGQWYGHILAENGLAKNFDLILPVPLHESKLYKRGYNQSDCFAKGLSKSMQLPWAADVLERTFDTQTQTKKKRFDRWLNVDEIFLVRDEEPIRNKRLLLVDDIITTGATLEACATELYKKNCKSVSIATIAAAM